MRSKLLSDPPCPGTNQKETAIAPVARMPAARVLRAEARDAEMLRWLPSCFRLLALCLGGLHAWTAAVQQSMSEDGISYLDMGDAYLRGDWSMAVNTVWSPLYAWILGLTMKLIQPSIAWEFPVVHLVNFAIYVLALIAFEFFWRRVPPDSGVRSARRSEQEVGFPPWAWLAVGYGLFIWASLSLIKIWAVTPDMLVAALLFLASGLLLQLGKSTASRGAFVLFGIVLGLAYLAKAVMFPMAFFLMAAGVLASSEPWRALPRMFAALLAFLIIAVPFVLLLSFSKGRPTFGDAGKLTYLRYANRIPYPHWKPGLASTAGTPHNPARQISESPAVFEFATPVGGTYPLAYDPSHWYEGVAPRFEGKNQLAVLITSSQFYFDLFVRQQGGITATVLLLLLAAKARVRCGGPESRGAWSLVMIALAAFGLYALVYVEGRYIGAFVILFWAGLVSLIRFPESDISRKLLGAGGAVVAGCIFVNIASFNMEGVSKILGPQRSVGQAESSVDGAKYNPVQLAESVLQAGLRPGDEIAFIGYSFGAFFARLARLRIVAEIPDWEAESFWHSSHAERLAVIETIRRTGAKAVIAERVSPGVSLEGWERIGNSRYLIYSLEAGARQAFMGRR